VEDALAAAGGGHLPGQALASCRHQLAPCETEVGEHEQREHLLGVLGDVVIADAAVAELAFEHTEHMLDLGADGAMPLVVLLLRGGKLAAGFALVLDRPIDARLARRPLLPVAGIAFVAEHDAVVRGG
jgi:hypothetical protein